MLTAKAEERLGIFNSQREPVGLGTVTSETLPRERSFGGEVTLPPGAAIIVSAPLSGTLQAPAGATIPKVGDIVAARQPIFSLLPLLSPERDVLTPAERIRYAESKNAIASAKIDAENQYQQALVQVEAAKIALERAQRLLKELAGPARAVDEAQAQYNIAGKALAAAQSRKQLLDGLDLNADVGQSVPLAIESPQAGMIRQQPAAVGEVVAAGEPLFEVMQLDPLWLRVSVYAGELDDLAAEQPAQVSSLSDPHGDKATAAPPIAAPPTAAPLASSLDLYFRLDNPQKTWRPGQRVAVRLKLVSAGDQLLLPWSAVLHDIQGGTWVYEQTSPQTYVRRRVDVRYVDKTKGVAILRTGPAQGAKVVTAGTMELFGTEFGFAK